MGIARSCRWKPPIGLLYDILQAIAESDLNIIEALIETDGDAARDTFQLADLQGGNLLPSNGSGCNGLGIGAGARLVN